MANMKQQIKRYKNADKKRVINTSYKTALKTAIKNVKVAVEAGNKEAAAEAYKVAASRFDDSVSNGILHKIYSSRQKSRLAKLVNSIA